MWRKSLKKLLIGLVVLVYVCAPVFGNVPKTGRIRGYLKIDSSWESVVYLSYIPTYDALYDMSNRMIIARAVLNSLGYFEIKTDFLPEETRLYRLHLTKKGDVPASIIIGGKSENFLFFLANKSTDMELISTSKEPPFRYVQYKNSIENSLFQQLSDDVNHSDSLMNESTEAKRAFLRQDLDRRLSKAIDTLSNPMISLYAVYLSDMEYSNPSQLESYLRKWKHQNTPYFEVLRSRHPMESSSRFQIWFWIILVLLITSVSVFVWNRKKRIWTLNASTNMDASTKTPDALNALSVQERKILELLKTGASNQEIADKFSIEVSTVKSHVSRILSKMKVKSRKELL
jgi:DNA-binding CsgD family transcriptional regulator